MPDLQSLLTSPVAASRPEVGVTSPGSIRLIKVAMCRRYGVRERDFQHSRSAKGPELAQARQLSAYLCCVLTRHSLAVIAEHLSYADHSGVRWARNVVQTKMRSDPLYAAMVRTISEQLQNHVPTK